MKTAGGLPGHDHPHGGVYKQHIGLLSPLVDGIRIRKVAAHVSAGARVLDVGCGPAWLMDRIPATCVYTGIDVDPDVTDMNRKARANARFETLDMTSGAFPFPSESFDAIVMAAVLEHVDEPGRVFKEAARVLAPGGRIIATTPSRFGGLVHGALSFFRLVSYHAADEHKDFLNRAMLKKILTGTGLSLQRFEFFEAGMNQLFILAR